MPRSTTSLLWIATVILSIGAGYVTIEQARTSLEEKHRVALYAEASRRANHISEQVLNGKLMGSVATLGAVDQSIKSISRSKAPVDSAVARDALQAVAMANQAETVFVVNESGIIIQSWFGTEKSNIGFDVKFRPYFQLALEGLQNVYAGISLAANKQSIYFSAPLYSEIFTGSMVVGAVVARVDIEAIESYLDDWIAPALLLSPQKVTFASNRKDWVAQLAEPRTPEQIRAIRALKQFGSTFESGTPVTLPIDTGSDTVLIDHRRHAVARAPVRWNDPNGDWSLVLTEDLDSVMPLTRRILMGMLGGTAMLALCSLFIYWRYRLLRMAKARQQQALEAQQVEVEKLKVIERMLEERVALRTTELQSSNAQLEASLKELTTAQAQLIQAEKMASLGQLVANVAHEINTPIGAVKSSGKNISDSLDSALSGLPDVFQALEPETRSLFIHLISNQRRSAHSAAKVLSTREERMLTRETAKKLEEAGVSDTNYKAGILVQLRAESDWASFLPLLHHPEAEKILQTASHVATIINNADNINRAVDRVAKIIFALKSFSRIDVIGERIASDLKEGIETVLTIYLPQIRQGVELVRKYESIPPLNCVPDELNQVWTNLIHNSLQAMDNKGTLTIGIYREGDHAVVSVGDTGCGIPKDIRGKIFDPFFTTKPAGEGSGIGLDISKKIIDKHGGRIEIESEVGVGTTFFVSLPYSEQ